ncbi:hypothetical protein H6F32_01065 [Anabaena sp. FACHB-1237]|uniref:WD40 domain-containing protein n=1 Tax=Anabaena sp. FACHB-1237 TaxID=2692769 RepID=UPI00168108F1|nr:hypothetical protein [Anabaena sp. FACHB-1237]MBD2136199.1 hypothetical protein [Anabaena sp. FACHB-1237]
MDENNAIRDIISANSRSLRSLERAIRFSNHEFSLILLCCNYSLLRELVLQQLVEVGWKKDKTQIINLQQDTKSIYTAIQSQMTVEQPETLMILGFESVQGIDDLLRSINQLRDEFRKQFKIPLILWLNDEMLQKLLRFAPDFASWAATPIRFEMTGLGLLHFLNQETENLFPKFLNNHYMPGNYATLKQEWVNSYEVHYALKELEIIGVSINPELNAKVQFIFGIDNYVNDQIKTALANFQESLQFWDREKGKLELKDSHFYELRKAVLLLYVGLCCCRLSEREPIEKVRYWQSAKTYFEQCLQSFEVAGRRDLVSKFIGQLIEVLYNLKSWVELRIVTQKSLELHQDYGSKIEIAYDYGILAQIAAQNLRWMQASILAHIAILQLEEAANTDDFCNYLFPLLLEQIYLLTLAKSLENIGHNQVAAEYLLMAREKLPIALENSDHQYDAHRYIRTLHILRSLYFYSHHYLEAYIIKQKRYSVEQQYGFRAFIGAGRLQPQRHTSNPTLINSSSNNSIALEITASGRENDVNKLIARISRSDQKLTIIHGPSGVGKSSIVTAGLVPALQNRAIGDQIAVPIVLQVYTDWIKELGKVLVKALLPLQNTIKITSESLAKISTAATREMILQQLRENADNHLITVLIFDQFEEFFFGCTDINEKKTFDKFICNCLDISFVKVILTLRQDYLHRLLEFQHLSQLEAINNNILDKNIRYELNNFSPENARKLIQELTQRSQNFPKSKLQLEPDLIDALVTDLAGELGEIRPIELQLAGAQLQNENITTLAEYEPYRPNKLIERYIKQLIKQCGVENQATALLVLYLLTDESNKRPYKTLEELATQLTELENSGNLELVLEILVRSGLVVVFPTTPERYQLIHDYLVHLIRYLQQQESGLQKQINKLRDQVKNSEEEIKRLKIELRTTKNYTTSQTYDYQEGVDLLTELRELRKREEQSQREIENLRRELKEKELTAQLADSQKRQRISDARLNMSLKLALTACLIAIFGLSISILMTNDSEMKTLSASSDALFASQKGIDALADSLKAGRKLKKTLWVNNSTKENVLTALYQAVYGVKERNRLEGHVSGVNMINFSPDKSLIASASNDMNINIWDVHGNLQKTLLGHEGIVNSVIFSPDSQMIVSASTDKTIKLWTRKGKLIKTIYGHKAEVNSVSFSPDGHTIVSASNDKTIKFWSREGQLIKTINLQHEVLCVSWSGDGEVIASSQADNTIKLWSKTGKLLNILQGHQDSVLSLAWSPNSKLIASGSLDKKIKLWSRQGDLINTLSGHSEGIISVSFSGNGRIIASGSADQTVKLWTVNGSVVRTLKGHSNWVNAVSFSPDGLTLASASRDKTIKLWRVDDIILRDPKINFDWITSLDFSPDSKMIVTSSRDKTVKLWNREGKLIKILKGHKDQVWGVAWSADSNMIASASHDKTVKLWSKEGTLLKTLSGHHDRVLTVAWSPDGQVLASAGKDTTIKLWTKEGILISTLKGHSKTINWLSFSPDGKLLASASDDKSVNLWSRNGKLVKSLTGHTRVVNGVAWSSDGKILASASFDSTVKIWSRDGELQKTLRGDGDGFISVSFSPNGKTIAASNDDQVRLWNKDGILLISLKGDAENITGVSFSPDGKIIAAGSGTGNLILRSLSDIKLDRLLQHNCDLLHDYLESNIKVTTSEKPLCKN